MTENTTPERAALLRREAAGICGRDDFDPPGQWPEYFPLKALAALMAGGIKNDHEAEYLKWQRRIKGAIDEGMEAERHRTIHTTKDKTIDTLGRITFAGLPRRIVASIPGKTTTTIHFRIRRQPFAAWLHAAGLEPSEHVRDWLGAEWEESNAGAAAPQPSRETRKKDAMIRELGAEWPSIDRDLTDASRNGLSAAAKAPKHGHWYISSAREWAKQEGKLRAAADSTAIQSASLAGQLKAATKIHREK